jgi:putative restriction endonuclease
MPESGLEREAIVKLRVNQNFFRATVLAAYDYKCCITGLNIVSLLNASHITPWAIDPKNRVNPKNGLCLNALHDRAFDRGLLTITEDYRIKISSIIKGKQDISAQNFLLRYDDIKMELPHKFTPDQDLLSYHRIHIFQNS